MSNDINTNTKLIESTTSKQQTETAKQDKLPTNTSKTEKKNIPSAVEVNPNEFNALKNAFSNRQNILAQLAVNDSNEIGFTNDPDPSTLDRIVNFDQFITVHYHEISNGQMFALIKKKAEIDDLDRLIVAIATQRTDKKTPLPEDNDKLNVKAAEKKEEYYNNLFTLLMDLPKEKRDRYVRTRLYHVADAWFMRAQFSLPKSANGSTSSFTSGVQ